MPPCRTSRIWTWISICPCQIRWTITTNKFMLIPFTRHKPCIKAHMDKASTCHQINRLACIPTLHPTCKVSLCPTAQLTSQECLDTTNKTWWMQAQTRLVSLTKDFKITMANRCQTWFPCNPMQWTTNIPWAKAIISTIQWTPKVWWTKEGLCTPTWVQWTPIQINSWMPTTPNAPIERRKLGAWTWKFQLKLLS